MKEGQDKIYYVTADTFRRGEEQPASRGVPQEGHRGAAACRSASTNGWSAICTNSRASRCSRSPRANSIWASSRTKRKRRSRNKASGEHKDLVEKIQKALGERVKEVRVTLRLTESPACLVAGRSTNSAPILSACLKAAGQKVPSVETHTRSQSAPSARATAQERGRRPALRRLEPRALRPGAAVGRRTARRPGGIRQAAEPVACWCLTRADLHHQTPLHPAAGPAVYSITPSLPL